MTGAALRDFQKTDVVNLELDQLDSGADQIVEVGAANKGHIQSSIIDGAWGSAVVTIERSSDGVNWVALSSPVTINSDTLTSITPDTNYLRARVSTIGSANDRARIVFDSRLN